MNKPSREFLGPIILYNATTVNTCHCMFFQTQSIKALQNVQGKYILWGKKSRFQLLLQNTLIFQFHLFANFLQTHSVTPKVNSNVNYGHWVIIMFQYKFINFKTCATVVQDFECEEGCTCASQGTYIWTMWLLLHCVVTLTVVQKRTTAINTQFKKETQIPKR